MEPHQTHRKSVRCVLVSRAPETSNRQPCAVQLPRIAAWPVAQRRSHLAPRNSDRATAPCDPAIDVQRLQIVPAVSTSRRGSRLHGRVPAAKGYQRPLRCQTSWSECPLRPSSGNRHWASHHSNADLQTGCPASSASFSELAEKFSKHSLSPRAFRRRLVRNLLVQIQQVGSPPVHLGRSSARCAYYLHGLSQRLPPPLRNLNRRRRQNRTLRLPCASPLTA
ncbi:hypothetical protein OB03_14670 [Brevundimonas sp. GN22]